VFHWLGKIYNSFAVRLHLADVIYDEQVSDEWMWKKWVALSPFPARFLPEFRNIKNDIISIRQIDKKMNNDLNYLWLVKYTSNIFQLSSALFLRPEERHLSMVFIK
jgi:hypothetical protein